MFNRPTPAQVRRFERDLDNADRHAKAVLQKDEFVANLQVGTMKASNPKDAVAAGKLPLHLWPPSATVYGALGLLDGMLKYGRGNWRAAGVKYTVYLDAIDRHAKSLLETEDTDPDSKLHHLSHILASAAILVDAMENGKLIDDRNYRGGYWRAFVTKMTREVGRLKDLHALKNPKHWTTQDNPPEVLNPADFVEYDPNSGLYPMVEANVGQPVVASFPQNRNLQQGELPCKRGLNGSRRSD